jgi:hypothetical protein
MSEWLKLAARADVVNRSLKVGLIVGTILTLINQGDALVSGTLTPDMLWKIPLTYLVPFCVSTYAGVGALRDLEHRQD